MTHPPKPLRALAAPYVSAGAPRAHPTKTLRALAALRVSAAAPR
jgi:hypothetical protein